MSKAAKPQLVAQLQGQHTGPINDAIYVPDHHAAISVSDDKNVLIWLRRDDGTYWPSVCHPMPFAPTALCYHHESRRLFVGMDQGSISEYVVSEDFNSMTTTRTMPAHSGRVRCIIYDHERQLVLSGAHDKCITLSSAADGKRLSAHSRPAWVTSLQYDEDTQNVFVGDYRGLIGVLKIVNNKLQFISNLEGHDGSVRSLLWVPERGYLFSGSFDKTVICWDVGGNKGISYELTGHRNKVRGLAYVLAEDILMSTGDDGMLALWNMKAERTPTPTWQDGDLCALCSEPFFWNFKAMWHKKSISFKRQHHCRRCGKAVCDKCSPSRQAYPVMGFEFAVRFCSTCATEVKDEPKISLVKHFPMQHEMLGLRYDPECSIITIWSNDGVIKLLDPSPVLASTAAFLSAQEAQATAIAAHDGDDGPLPAPGADKDSTKVVDMTQRPTSDDEDDASGDLLSEVVGAEDHDNY